MLESWVPFAEDPELCRLDHHGPPWLRALSDDTEQLFYKQHLVKLASAPTGAAHAERLDDYASVLFKALR